MLVCDGDRSTIAKALMDFQTVSSVALNRSASVKNSNITDGGVVVDDDVPKNDE